MATGTALFRSRTSHFTSFAVLFGSSPLRASSCDWIWIACIAIAGEMNRLFDWNPSRNADAYTTNSRVVSGIDDTGVFVGRVFSSIPKSCHWVPD